MCLRRPRAPAPSARAAAPAPRDRAARTRRPGTRARPSAAAPSARTARRSAGRDTAPRTIGDAAQRAEGAPASGSRRVDRGGARGAGAPVASRRNRRTERACRPRRRSQQEGEADRRPLLDGPVADRRERERDARRRTAMHRESTRHRSRSAPDRATAIASTARPRGIPTWPARTGPKIPRRSSGPNRYAEPGFGHSRPSPLSCSSGSWSVRRPAAGVRLRRSRSIGRQLAGCNILRTEYQAGCQLDPRAVPARVHRRAIRGWRRRRLPWVAGAVGGGRGAVAVARCRRRARSPSVAAATATPATRAAAPRRSLGLARRRRSR